MVHNSPNGELEVVHNSPNGELEVVHRASFSDGSDDAGLVVPALGDCSFDGLNNLLRGACCVVVLKI